MKIINNFPKLTKLDNIENELTDKAPIDHSSTTTNYGAGSSSNYGHVKLSDSYTTSDGAAASGIGASSAAVYNAYNTLNSNLIWKTLSNSDGIGRSFNIPSDTKELNIIVYINANGNYFFYDMHIINWNNYRSYRFFDGYSKANVLFNNGKITLSSTYVNDVDFTSTSYLEIKYR